MKRRRYAAQHLRSTMVLFARLLMVLWERFMCTEKLTMVGLLLATTHINACRFELPKMTYKRPHAHVCV